MEDELKEAIIDAAMRAPTAGNLMAYSIIEVTDREKKRRLSVSCDNQPFIAKAPLLLLFLADYQKLFDFFEASGVRERCGEEGREIRTPGPGELMLGMSDALIAAENAVIAADSLGLASCYIGDIFEHYEEHREMFDLPEYAFPATLLAVGYPKEEYPPKSPVPRCEKKYVHFTDSYRRFSGEEISELLEPNRRRLFPNRGLPEDTENMGLYVWKKKYDSSFMAEMERSLFAAMEPWLKGRRDDTHNDAGGG